MELHLNTKNNIKESTKQMRENIYRRLMMTSTSISCPEGRKVTQLCINSQCPISLRCNQTECEHCGTKIHESCFSMPLEEVAKLFNFKVEKWTDWLMNIFTKEEEIIDKIREGRQQFISQFFELQLQQTGLSFMKRFHRSRSYNSLSGDSALNMMKELQKRLKINEEDISKRCKQYSQNLIISLKDIEYIRLKSFISQSDLLASIQKGTTDTFEVSRNYQIPKKISIQTDQKIVKYNQRPSCQLQGEEKQKKIQQVILQLNYLSSKQKTLMKTAQVCFNDGIEHHQNKQYQNAIQCYQNAITIDPDYAQAYLHLGITLYDLGKNEEAIENYISARQLDQDNLRVHYHLGIAFDKIGKHEQAISSYKKIIIKDPKNVEALYQMGLAYQHSSNIKEAIQKYQIAIKCDPKYAKAYNNLGSLYFGVQRYQQAINKYNQAIWLDTSFEDPYMNLERILVEQSYWRSQNMLRKQAKYLKQITEIWPNQIKAQQLRSKIMNQIDKHKVNKKEVISELIKMMITRIDFHVYLSIYQHKQSLIPIIFNQINCWIQKLVLCLFNSLIIQQVQSDKCVKYLD